MIFQTPNLRVDHLDDTVAALVLDVVQGKTNALTSQVLGDLEAALDQVAATASLELLVVQSGKIEHFSSGYDLGELASLADSGPAAVRAFAEQGQKTLNRLGQLRIPSVAVIAGSCLGGGLELALACDYRVVVDRPGTRLGLPQVEWGLLPAWGGTQRLPRLIGLERALPLLLGGKKIGPAAALACGLADALVGDHDDDPPAFLWQPEKRQPQGLPRQTWRQFLLESHGLGRRLLYRGAARLLRQRVPENFPAPEAVLQTMRSGLEQGFNEGLQVEREALTRLAQSEACHNLLQLSLRSSSARLLVSRSAHSAALRRVGIIGCDDFANTLTQMVVMAGAEAVVREPDRTALGFALLQLVARFQQAQREGFLSAEESTRKLNAIRVTTSWESFADLDLILVPPLTEHDGLAGFFADMELHLSADTILASLDPTVAVQEVQESLGHPGRCAGLHFFPPLAAGSLVEIVAGSATAAATLATLGQWLALLGHKTLAVPDRPCGLVYRLLLPYWNEAAQLVSEHIPPTQIDQSMRRFGMPLGPLECLDQLGLDTAGQMAEALAEEPGRRFSWHPLFAAMEEQNWLGRKTKAGFFNYRGGQPRHHYQLANLLDPQKRPRAVSGDEQRLLIQNRLVPVLVNEAARSLEDQLVEGSAELDQALVWANAWPAHRGGPLRYAQHLGYQAMVKTLEEKAAAFGARYQPCAWLKKLAEEKGTFGFSG